MTDRSRKKATRKSAEYESAERRPAASRSAGRVSEPAALIRRKNFDLDQSRIDRVRHALGARTEREAITRAMDIALDVVAFENEVAAGAHALFGEGGFENVFDEPAALDFSGFTSAPAVRRKR